MSIRNLDAVFHPKSIALIGASTNPKSVGFVTARNLLAGGFGGPIMPVNPKHTSVAGMLAYPDVASLPVVPDLAVICTPPATVPGLIAELGARETKGAVVITAGFKELGSAQGRALEQALLDAARPHLLRVVGPNCLGIVSTPSGVNASFSHIGADVGRVAFVSQSGAMATTVLDWAAARGIGFSHLVSLGDMSDVDFGDMLDYLALDDKTDAILLYVEAITQARKFMSAARAASRIKPVIAIKAGRNAAAARAAASHTGALAGADAVYDAAFRRAGILRVLSLDEVFDALETLATGPKIAGERLAILTNGGGMGVLATDALLDQDGRLAELTPDTLAKLDAVLPRTWSRGNPVDIIGDAPGSRYRDALTVLLGAPEVDAVLALNCPTAIASSTEAAEAVIDAASKNRRPVLTSWLGAQSAGEARRLFAAARIPTYDTPDEAIRGFMHLVRRRRGQELLMQAPPAAAEGAAPDVARARGIVERALVSGREWLGEPEMRGLLSCYGIPTVHSAIAATPAEAAALAREIGGRVALKIFSPDITHKSDIGGVALDLDGPEAVQSAAEQMRAHVAKAAPKARLDGFVVQQMVRRSRAYELILGIATDAQFGPVLLFGHGGTGVEVIGDKALALPPLNSLLARELISHTRINRQLKGYRDRPAAAIDEIALTLVKLSQLACDLDEVAELDINPLLADEAGIIALDARVRVARPVVIDRRGGRLAIPAYPKELERQVSIHGTVSALLRPIRPEDAPAISRLFDRLTPEDIRMRFFAPMRGLQPEQLAKLTQIDYDREMAFVLEVDEQNGREIAAVVRLAADPDNRRAEFAATVRSDLKGHGIGRLMMLHLIDYGRMRGIGEIFGDILQENTMMIALCRELGFALAPLPETATILRAALKP